MNDKPSVKELIEFVNTMAIAMNLNQMSLAGAEKLINHILFNEVWNGFKGKEVWKCFENSLITERELRNLLIAHSATKISAFNKVNESSLATYNSKDLCYRFERALFGKLVVPLKTDQLDPWE